MSADLLPLDIQFAPGIAEIELDDLQANPLNVRVLTGSQGIKALADSISREGLLHPVVVRPGQNEKFELVCGERRWRAFLLLQKKDPDRWSRIPARVVKVDDAGVLALMHRENTMRNDWLPYEKALFYKQAWESGRFASLRTTAATLGLGVTTMHRYLRLFDLPQKYLTLFEKGILGMMEMELMVEAPSALRSRLVKGFREDGWGKKEARSFLKEGCPQEPSSNPAQLTLDLKQAGFSVRKGKGKITFTWAGDNLDEALELLKKTLES